MIVTIDGPAGTGKSTMARLLADRLGFQFLDTGAMYRVVALKCLQSHSDLNDETAAGRIARDVRIGFRGMRVFADGEDVTEQIRANEVTEGASRVAAHPPVREAMVELQRQAADGADIVTEGRDQGTFVFPHADCKFFLTADAEVRARRRQQDLQTQGIDLPFEEVLAQLLDRDHRDENRSVGPLCRAEDALIIDTTDMTPDEVLDRLEQIVLAQRESKATDGS